MTKCKHNWDAVGRCTYLTGKPLRFQSVRVDWCVTCGAVREELRVGSGYHYRYPKDEK